MIPDYQTCMLPLLKFLADGKEHKTSELIEKISAEFNLSDEEKTCLLASGTQTVIYNRVNWAKTYLKKARLLCDAGKGFVKITERGKQVLAENPKNISTKYLKQFDEFLEFQNHHNDRNDKKSALNLKKDELLESENQKTPDEMIRDGIKMISENLADEILSKIAENSPSFFENLVIDLLVHMGYGGNFEEAAEVVGKTGDEGIDGIIKEDKLGLDSIYVQAKRWKGQVGRPEIQKFAGALLGRKASKGVFITTSNFSKEATDYASSINQKIVLIDGQKLAQLMIEFNVGVSIAQTYLIKKIDSDYFEEQ